MIKDLYHKIFNSKFTKDSVWILISQLFLAVNGIIINIFITNFYSTELLGVFNLGLSYFLIFATISNFGLFNSTVKYVSEDMHLENSGKIILANNIKMVFLISSTMLALFFLLIKLDAQFFPTQNVEKAVKVIFLAIPGFAMNRIFMAYYNGIRNMKLYSILRLFRWGGYVIFIVLLSLLYNDFYKTLNAFIITEYSIFLFMIFYNYKAILNKFNFFEIKKSIQFGSKSFLSEIVANSQDKLDIIIIGYLLIESDAGLYSFLAAIAKGILIIPSVFMQNVNPIVSNLWKKENISEIQNYINKIKLSSIKIMIPFASGAFVFYLIVIYYFMPNEYQSTKLIFTLMILGSLIQSYISWSGGFLLMAGKLYPNLYRVIVLLFLSVFLNIIFIHYFKLLGAGLSFLVFCLLVVLINNYFIKKHMKLSLLK